ncbi:Lacal_2735 family protein [Antarcticibacterium sp. 1MA-6-2]|uniref:Lacal_2735 family protein n=1 Tax=Antarcticibacterium sp. 1MA-6-2 TaxID=2908210 RepID=UPI001F2AA3E2|nr:Lacal_2735 family protein [Antarcticibacterium sp. 1MA-6-2]UJH92600.1 Lacal_2735 family protein [Antarcticibacterium sp. 1MA-6-2]
MFGFLFKSEEDRLSHKYTQLMNRAFQLALVDKEKSDKINERARKIREQLRRMNYKKLDNFI